MTHRPTPATFAPGDLDREEIADSLAAEASRSAVLAIAGMLFGLIISAVLDIATSAHGLRAMAGL